jgi:hypothetical protein
MPNPGDVLYHSNFKFTNGSYGKKLLIVLNKSEISTDCLVLKTTSQSTRYQNVKTGCNPEKQVFYIPKVWQHFDLDTYIQLPQIFAIPTNQLIKNGMNKFIQLQFTLEENCFRQLLNCLKRYFKDDIATEHWDLIFR